MRYRRETRCGNCWQRGHTKPQCPTLSEYWKEEYKKIAKTRACTHCSRNGYDNAIGHNKRGCLKYREDREAYKKDVLLFRKLCIQHFEKYNVGIGTVITQAVPPWRRYGQYSEIETDIFFVKEMFIPKNLSRPTFRLQSTINGSESFGTIVGSGMESIIRFQSFLPRIGTREVYMGEWREKDGMSVLTPGLEGVSLVQDLSELEKEYNIEFPDIME